ncbi:MAG: 6-pyruvoyl-tetrahydropterin synthase-related protein [Erysipelotrichaceae bacterium]
MEGHDTLFHLYRIDALSHAFTNGDFFPKLFYLQNYEFGYATPLFYSNLFIYIPAIINFIGFSVVDSYKIFLFICTFMTSLTMFYSSYKLLQKKNAALIATCVYIFATFRITDVYVRGAVGEVLSIIFIPLIIYSIVDLLYRNGNRWFLLSISFSMLLLSHNISFVLMVVFFALMLILNVRKIFNKRMLLILLKSVIFAILFCSFFLLPMLEQSSIGIYEVNQYFSESTLLQTTLFFEQLFKFETTFGYAGHSFSMWESATLNVGFVLTFTPILWLFKPNKKSYYSIFFIMGYILIFMTTDYFPWKYFTFLSFMQFPWRVLVLAMPLLSFVIGDLFDQEIINRRKFLLSGFIALTILIGCIQLYPVLYKDGKVVNLEELVKKESYYNHNELAAGDYLPYDNGIDYVNYGDYIITNNVDSDINDFSRRYNSMNFTIDNVNKGDFYTFPLIYYKGYSVIIRDLDGKLIENLAVYPNDQGLLSAKFAESYDFSLLISIHYEGTKIQFLGGLISITTILFTIVYLSKKYRIL